MDNKEKQDKQQQPVHWDESMLFDPFEESIEEGRKEGRMEGSERGFMDGQRIGCALATEIGIELGFILGCCEEILKNSSLLLKDPNKRERLLSNVEIIKTMAKDNFFMDSFSSSHHEETEKLQTSAEASDIRVMNQSDEPAREKVDFSSLFNSDIDVRMALQNIRSKFKLVLIQIKMPNHTFQNILKWGAEGETDLKTSHSNSENLKTNVIESTRLQEW